jgi:hypothetical protein
MTGASISRPWVIEKKPKHLVRGVRSLRIRVGSGGTATRPGVARSVNDPLLEDCLPASVPVHDAAVGAATRYATLLNRFMQTEVQRFPELRDDLIAVVWMHRRVPVSMEDNRRDDARTGASTRTAGGCDGAFMARARAALEVKPEEIAAGNVWVGQDAGGSRRSIRIPKGVGFN